MTVRHRNGAYPIVFADHEDVLAELPSDSVIVTDDNLALSYSEALARFNRKLILPSGEESKSFATYQAVLQWLAEMGVKRSEQIVAFGGGVIGDLGGFCAAIYQRGIPYVQVPTTVLPQVDSSVGGKTGVNLPDAKNMVGSFHQPVLVLADTDTLKSLHKREFNEGFAEIIKHAGIRDAAMYDAIDEVADGRGDLAELIRRNIAIKAHIVEEDEFETKGLRALLNYGHTLGHAIEAAAGYGQLLHGEAISLGLRAASWLSMRLGGLSAESHARTMQLLKKFELPLVLGAEFEREELLRIARMDKKFEKGRIRFVLLRAAGDAYVSPDVTEADLAAALEELTRQPA